MRHHHPNLSGGPIIVDSEFVIENQYGRADHDHLARGLTHSGIPIETLTTTEFRAAAKELFGFNGTEKQARTLPGWLAPERVEALMTCCRAAPRTARG